MSRVWKSLTVLMLMMVFAVSCNKPDGPNNGNGQQNDSIIDNDGMLNGHAYVDLGLPSGILWATCNLGADTPEDFGDYYAWGETAPKEHYDWNTALTRCLDSMVLSTI